MVLYALAASGAVALYNDNLDTPLATVACLHDGAVSCPRADSCRTLPIWAEYDRMTHDFFYGKTLSDVIRQE